MTTLTEPRLSSEQVKHYQDEGYLLFNQPVFTEHKFQALRDYFDELLEELPEGKRPEHMDVPHITRPKLFDWIFDDDVLDIVEPILGPDIALFSSHFICKPKGDGRRVPWHEDSAYWKGILDPMEVVTVWLAVDESTEENACMRVIPRTQHNGYSDYDAVDSSTHVFGTEVVKAQRDDSKAVSCILQPNECSLHNAKLIHGSEANTSTKRRCGYTMRFVRADTVLLPKGQDRVQLYMARGNASDKNTYADPTKAYPDFWKTRKGGVH